MSTVRTERSFRRRGQRFQDVFVNGPELRKEVKEGGRTFKNLADYLIKYHRYKHFALVAGSGGRVDKDWWIRIRRKGWLERLFRPTPDGAIWEVSEHV